MADYDAAKASDLCGAHPRGQARPTCDLDADHAGDHYSITQDASWPSEARTSPDKEGR